MSTVSSAIDDIYRSKAPSVHRFWNEGGVVTDSDLLTHCDYIYTMNLLGRAGELKESSVGGFRDSVMSASLFGTTSDRPLSAHLTAYVLGSLNLLALNGFTAREDVLLNSKFELDLLIDRNSKLPIWPRKWSHHTWRVSHWIGGIASILLTVSRHDPKNRVPVDLLHETLRECDRQLLTESGLLKAYRSEWIQMLFRSAYKLRHDPRHGDIGGLVHLHWVNYAVGRPYKGCEKVLDICFSHLSENGFLENVPYCLDFDYIQIIRTGLEQVPSLKTEKLVSRMDLYSKEILQFVDEHRGAMTPHKVPGALAAAIEAQRIVDDSAGSSSEIEFFDVIKHGYWL